MASIADIHGRPGFMLKRLHQVATALFIEECRPWHMTPSQYQALVALAEHPGIDQVALGRLIGQDRSTISLVVRLLLDRGLVSRVVNTADKRRLRLAVTDEGQALLGTMQAAVQRAQARFLEALPASQRDLFVHLLATAMTAHGASIEPDAVLGARRAAMAAMTETPVHRRGHPRPAP